MRQTPPNLNSMRPVQATVLFLITILVNSAYITDNYEAGISPDQVTAYRLFIKERNEKYVHEVNAQRRGFTLEAYPEFARLTPEEFSERYSNKEMGRLTSGGVEFVVEARPQIDMRKLLNKFSNGRVNNSADVGPIKAQGQCGGCYAFAGNSVVNYAYNKYYAQGPQMRLASEQEIIECSYAYRNNGCDGGWPHQAMQYVRLNGVFTDRRYRYRYDTYMSGKVMDCAVGIGAAKEMGIDRSSIKISQYNTVQSMKNIIDHHKVAAIGISTKSPNLIFYRSGILSDCGNFTKMDHAVTNVGYIINQEREERAWLIRNSWGVKWGIQGYFYLSMEGNTCNMLNYASYLVTPSNTPR